MKWLVLCWFMLVLLCVRVVVIAVFCVGLCWGVWFVGCCVDVVLYCVVWLLLFVG